MSIKISSNQSNALSPWPCCFFNQNLFTDCIKYSKYKTNPTISSRHVFLGQYKLNLVPSIVWRDFSWRNIAWSYLWKGFNLLSAGGTQAQGKVRCNAIGSSMRHSKSWQKQTKAETGRWKEYGERILPQSPAQSTVLSSSGRGWGGEGKKNNINDRLTDVAATHTHTHSLTYMRVIKC